MKLEKKIEELKKSEVKKTADKRMKEFSALGKKGEGAVFNELCFCLLTANYNAEKAMRIQKEMGNCFSALPKASLARKLKSLGYRYPNKRAEYIFEAQKHRDSLKETVRSFQSERESREWLVQKVKGFGYKEASHFLRNIGCRNCAIIDFHILDLMEKEGLMKKPKTFTGKQYLLAEKKLEKIAEKTGLSLAELDLYLWFMETGMVLK